MTDKKRSGAVSDPIRGPVWALGLMSGTSMDGIDAALVETDGETVASFGPALSRPCGEGGLAEARRIADDPLRYRGKVGEEEAVSAAEAEVTRLHAEAAADLLARAPVEMQPTVIGFPGQTVAHCPEEGWTWQIGDGHSLARAMNRQVIWDFRSQDMEAGGQGAPLAPFFHFALAKYMQTADSRNVGPIAFLNIGGVANVTWVDPRCDRPEDPGALVAFDTGPGNALLDDWMLRHTGQAVDADGTTAARGNPDTVDLSTNFTADYWGRPPPKSLDRNAFAPLMERLDGCSVDDGAAVLTHFTVQSVSMATQHLPSPPELWLVCGGGRHNRTIMECLSRALTAPVKPIDAVGFDGDALEAQAFAHLAVRALRGLPTSAPSTTGCEKPVCGGRVSLPED